jgi:hypothetical protein
MADVSRDARAGLPRDGVDGRCVAVVFAGEPQGHEQRTERLSTRSRPLGRGAPAWLLALHGVERLQDGVAIGRPSEALLGHHLPDQRREAARRDGLERRRLLEQDPGQQLERVAARERRRAGQRMVEHTPEREDVHPGVRDLAPDLLGSHVRRRPDDASEGRHDVEPRPAREPEIEELRAAELAVHQEHVLGLHVAVDEAGRVDDLEAAREALREHQRLVSAQGAARESAREVFSLEPLHREERAPVGGAPVSDVAHDAIVGERGERR